MLTILNHRSLLALLVLLFASVNCDNTNVEPNYVEMGNASYYANLFVGRMTASGEFFSQDSLTAAHRTLPFGTKVLVTNPQNDKSISVRINDRGPFIKHRIIDVTRRAADSLDFLRQGVINVVIEANVDSLLSKKI